MDFAASFVVRPVAANTVGIRFGDAAAAFPLSFGHAMQPAMGDEKVIELIGRIDRALARIEAAARAPAPSQPTPDDGRVAALEETHRALRARVERAIAQIDRLLDAGEND
jgi:hypothetical protein